jgi:acetylornithine deacetylase
MQATAQAWTEADRQRDWSIGLLQDMIRAGRDGEAAVQDLVAARLAELGCTVERLRYRPQDVPVIEEFAATPAMDLPPRESVIGRATGRGHGRSLIFFAHPDGEPVRGTEAWRHDPFAGTIDSGRLYGWGVADDLLGVAVAIAGLRAALAGGTAPEGDVIVASTPSKRHARGVAAVLHHGTDADAAVYLHPAESGLGLGEIKAFASGQLEFSITVDGRLPDTTEPGHTAFAHLAVNPIDKAWIIWRALQALGERRAARIRHPALEAAVGRSTNLVVSAMHAGEGRFTRVAPSCTLGAALSFPPTEKLAAVQAEVAAAVAEAASGDDWLRAHPPRIAWLAGMSGIEVPVDSPLYRCVAGAVTAVAGIVPHVNPLHTSSDIRNPFVQKGIPTVGLGPLAGDLTQVGGHDEWVDVEDYLRAVKVAATIVTEWCGAATPSGR